MSGHYVETFDTFLKLQRDTYLLMGPISPYAHNDIIMSIYLYAHMPYAYITMLKPFQNSGGIHTTYYVVYGIVPICQYAHRASSLKRGDPVHLKPWRYTY